MDEEHVARAVKLGLEQAFNDMGFLLRAAAMVRSAEFVVQNLPLHLGKTHGQLRSDAVNAADPAGLHLELGVGEGRWINNLAQAFPARLSYGFDSFSRPP